MSTPTEEEIAKLPLRAQVAFAARCARRVQPLFSYYWPDAPAEHVEAVSRAARLASGLGGEIGEIDKSDTALGGGRAQIADILSTAADDARRAATACGAREDVAAAALTAALAADGAASANDALMPRATARAARAALSRAASGAAARAARAALGTAAHAPLVDAINIEFGALQKAALKSQWRDLTPVSPEFFGPMWPNGPPSGWPMLDEDTALGTPRYAPPEVLNAIGPDQPRIDVIWDPARITPEEYAALIEAIGDVVRAAGGLGVERVGFDNFGAKVGEGVLR